MNQQILVPLDGSALAETIVPHAMLLARSTGRELLLLHVVTPEETSQTMLWTATMPAGLRREWEEARLTHTHAYLAALAARLRPEGISVQTDVLVDRDPASAIVRRAERDPIISAIAMASHGRSGLSRWVLGSVATKVLQGAPKPLLLLRAHEGSNGSVLARGYRTIVVPLDGSDIAAQALEHAGAIAVAAGADLVLMSAVSQPDEREAIDAAAADAWANAEDGTEYERLEQYLNHTAAQLARRGCRVHTRLVAGPPAEAILSIGAPGTADLIVMATHGRTGLTRLWLGSVAAKVAQSAEVPLLLIRARDGEEARASAGTQP